MNRNLLVIGSVVVILGALVICTVIITDNQRKIMESQEAILNRNHSFQNVDVPANDALSSRTIIGFNSDKTAKELEKA